MSIPPLPEPPANLADWLILAGLILAAIEAARRRLINPILRTFTYHTKQHERLMNEVVPNGDEGLLPPDEQGKPLRQLVIKTRVATIQLSEAEQEHAQYTARVVREANADRVERGLPPLEEP